jgi:hypothetical protein
MLCGERYCIGVAPVEEMFDFFNGEGGSWFHRQVEAIGAIDRVGGPQDASDAFRVWSVQLFEETMHRSGGEAPTLEGYLTRSA